MRVLITRAAGDAANSAAKLSALGHLPVICPLSTIIPLGANIPEGHFDAVVATSAHAFSGVMPGQLAHVPVYAVGEHTAGAASAAGFDTIISGPGTAAGLAAQIISDLSQGTKTLFLAGETRKPTIEAALQGAGIGVSVLETYRVVEHRAAIHSVDLAGIDAVLHYSQLSATRFSAAVREAGLEAAARQPHHLCLSADVAKGLASLQPLSILVASAADEASLFALLAICRS